MTINGTIGTMNEETKVRARGTGHSPVVLPLPCLVDNGVLPAGLLVEENVSGELIPMTVIANVVGVLDEEIDTAKTGSGLAVVHGSVRSDVVASDLIGTALTAAEIKALREMGIFVE